jgi:prepilin-type N-terminal cleavage/methylation domain-containing protein
MNKLQSRRVGIHTRAFTLLELLVAVVLIGILICMLLPATRRVREASRRTQCLNNSRQLILGELNYEQAHMKFPVAYGNKDFSVYTNEYERLSGLVVLLPFIEQVDLHEQIIHESSFDGIDFQALPSPTSREYPPWQKQLSQFSCPASSSDDSIFGETNYAFCIGDVARDIHRPQEKLRGVFGYGRSMSFHEITDGSSNTFAMVEIGNRWQRTVGGDFAINQPTTMLGDPSLCLSLVDAEGKLYLDSVTLSNVGRGGCWADGSAGSGIVNTILPPKSPSCAVGGAELSDGLYSSSSDHPGVIVAAMCDGSVHSVEDSLDCGDIKLPTKTSEQLSKGEVASSYGVWGSLGTANDGSTVNVLDFWGH